MTTGQQRKETLCRYHMHGACTKGESCPFSHVFSDLPNTVCTHWLKGHCAFGDKCRYDHQRPEWAPRTDNTVPGYTVPAAVSKPDTDDLDDLPPISKLRLGGAVAHLQSPASAPGNAAAAQPPQQQNTASSAESAQETLYAVDNEQNHPRLAAETPIELPSDPFGAAGSGDGEESSGTENGPAAALSLPDELVLDSETLQTKLQVDTELLAAASAQEEAWGGSGGGGGGGGSGSGNGFYGNGSGVFHGEGQEVYDGTETAEAAGYYEEGVIYDEDGTAVGYYGGDEQYDQHPYFPGGPPEEHYTHPGASGYGSYEASSGGEYGAFPSAGTSPGMAAAWHVPGMSGPGSDEGGWGAGVGVPDPSRFYTPPAVQSFCSEYYTHGVCSAGENCTMAHGEYCETCSHYALHPVDGVAREAHAAECRARHDRLDAIRRSAHVECGICMEKVTEKPPPADRRFGLLNCEHPFCLSCIRSWRQNFSSGADVEQALRTCPICRVATHFITPSTVWPATQEERVSIVAGYKAKLAEIDCRHFDFGDGTCPFGTSCMYKHMYKDGSLEETAPRRVAADEGEVHVVQPVRLSDFIVVQRGKVRGRRR